MPIKYLLCSSVGLRKHNNELISNVAIALKESYISTTYELKVPGNVKLALSAEKGEVQSPKRTQN